MRTRIILICLLLFLAALVIWVGIVSDETRDPTEIRGGGPVAASFYPLAFAAEQLGRSEVEVENLTPPGTEPHDLEVSADVVEELQSAELVILMGDGFQPQLEDAADDASGEVIEVLDAPGLDPLAEDDPHVWLDPIRYRRVVMTIGEELGSDKTVTLMAGRLKMLNGEYRRGLADCDRREIVTSHDAFGYLADRYELRQIPITGLSPEAEPSPGELADSIEAVRETGATVVFSEALVSPRLSEVVAREAGADTEVLNTLEGLTEDEEADGEDYFSLMRENLSELREALGCR